MKEKKKKAENNGSFVLHRRVSSLSACSVERQCPDVGEACTGNYGRCTTHGTCGDDGGGRGGGRGEGGDCQCSVTVVCERDSQVNYSLPSI